MNKQNRMAKANEPPAPLGERLQAEATASRPVFSESLHRRIAGAIAKRQIEKITDASPIGVATPHRKTFETNRSRWIAAVITACCAATILVAVGLHTGYLNKRSATIDIENPLAAVPPPDVWATGAWDEAKTFVVSASPLPPSDRIREEAKMLADNVLQRLPIDMQENDLAAETR